MNNISNIFDCYYLLFFIVLEISLTTRHIKYVPMLPISPQVPYIIMDGSITLLNQRAIIAINDIIPMASINPLKLSKAFSRERLLLLSFISNVFTISGIHMLIHLSYAMNLLIHGIILRSF